MEEEKPQLNKDKNNLERAFKWIGIIVFVFGIIFVSIYIFSAEDFSYGGVFFVIFIVTLISLILIFFFRIKERMGHLSKKYAEQIQIPEAVTPTQLEKHLKNNALKNKNFLNEIKEIEKVIPHHVGPTMSNSNLIYDFKIKSLYKNEDGDDLYHIIYNANYPNINPAIIPGDDGKEIGKAIKGMSKIKEEETPEETTRSFNPITQTYIEHNKKGKEQHKNNNNDKPKGDLE
jgi:hypothetical protein